MLRSNRPVTVLYETTFLINWPRHLGGGQVELPMHGAMVLVPVMGLP